MLHHNQYLPNTSNLPLIPTATRPDLRAAGWCQAVQADGNADGALDRPDQHEEEPQPHRGQRQPGAGAGGNESRRGAIG